MATPDFPLSDAERVRWSLRQYARADEILDAHFEGIRPFVLTPDLVLEIQRLGAAGQHPLMAAYRPWAAGIHGSPHTPPSHHDVPAEVEAMCSHVMERLETASPFYLGAYVLWRTGWIHPFLDGNGRLARVLCYMVMSVALGFRPLVAHTFAAYLLRHRDAYLGALHEAGAAWRQGRIDLTALEGLLSDALAEQVGSLPRAP
jgi:Fic family protein